MDSSSRLVRSVTESTTDLPAVACFQKKARFAVRKWPLSKPTLPTGRQRWDREPSRRPTPVRMAPRDSTFETSSVSSRSNLFLVWQTETRGTVAGRSRLSRGPGVLKSCGGRFEIPGLPCSIRDTCNGLDPIADGGRDGTPP